MTKQYHKSFKHVVLEGETLSSIRDKYPYIPHWNVLAEFNNLEYPYIVSRDETVKAKAGGQVRFGRKTSSTDEVVVPKGTLVGYKRENTALLYLTEDEVSITGTFIYSEDVNITAIDYGEEYNINSNKLNYIENESLNDLLNPYNVEPITGGLSRNVIQQGDVLYIPFRDHFTAPEEEEIDFVSVFGIDIHATDNIKDPVGVLDYSSQKDLLLVAGVENLSQALIRRVITPIGSVVKHPTYGSRLKSRVAQAIQYDFPELLKVDTIDALIADPRVQKVDNVDVSLHGDSAEINCRVTTISGEGVSLNFIINE